VAEDDGARGAGDLFQLLLPALRLRLRHFLLADDLVQDEVE
jgi:hypothetical protein